MDYKLELPGGSDDEKKEFLYDVSSFGNASGGDIIYGVKGAVDTNGKKTGGPESVQPLVDITAENAKLKLEQMILNGIAPRLRIQIKEIKGWGSDGNGFVIFARIQQSFSSPHMVTFKGGSRFFSRNSSGKYPLDVHELRAAFLSTETQADKIKNFPEDRLGKIVADETPVRLSSSHRLIIHVIPFSSFFNNEKIASASASPSNLSFFNPINSGGRDLRLNVDGFVSWSGSSFADKSNGYCQLYFNGVVESVWSDILDETNYFRFGNIQFLPSGVFEKELLSSVYKYICGLDKLNAVPPIIILTTLIGCKGSYMAVRTGYSDHSIDRNTIFLPDVVIESWNNFDVTKIMKPVLDAVWNAYGFQRSLNYDNQGNYVERG